MCWFHRSTFIRTNPRI